MTIKNRHLFLLLIETVRLYYERRKIIRSGKWLDVPYEQKDQIYEIPELSPEQQNLDYIPWPLPEMTPVIKKRLLADIKLMI